MTYLAFTLPLATLGCAGNGAAPRRCAQVESSRSEAVDVEPAAARRPLWGADSVIRTVAHEAVSSGHASPATVESIEQSVIGLFDESAHDEIHATTSYSPRASASPRTDDVRDLVASGLAASPRLARLHAEAAAAWARVPQVEGLPDPTAAANVFASPIQTASGSQRANFTFGQRLPFLKRLRAEGQRAAFTAMSLDHLWQAEALKFTADVRRAYYALYLVDRRIAINESNRALLEGLIEIATQKIGQGQATQGDVLLGTVEIGKLADERIELRRMRIELLANLNAMLNRPSGSPVAVAETLDPAVPSLDVDVLRQLAYERQPEIAAAHLRTSAADWGIRVADLADVPDLTVGFSWFGIDDNRPPSRVVDVGEDAWSVGASVNLPIYREKYRAMEREAIRRKRAARFETDEVLRRYDAVIAEFVERARAADETAELYELTIVPQARQTLETDQLAYGQGTVDFDRVIRDFRNVVTLEVGYHRAVSDLATAIARLEQAVAVELAPLTPALDAPPADDALPLPAPVATPPAPPDPIDLD